MKKKAFLFLAALALTSCSGTSSSKIDRTTNKSAELNASFKVLQLTDLHFTYSTDVKKVSKFVTASVAYANPDLIVVTGDSLYNTSKGVVNSLFNMLESWKIPYYFLFGNHEFQGSYSESWFMSKLYSTEYCYNTKKGINGESGYSDDVFTLTKNGKPFFQIYTFDTHNSINIDGVTYYDTIKDDQIDFYEREAKKAKEQNAGINVPSLGFLHIPQWEIVDAYISNKNGILGELHESGYSKIPELTEKNGGNPLPFYVSYKKTSFFEKAKNLGMKGMFYGHDHANDWVGEYQGVAIGYGVKATRELQYGKTNAGYDMIGGSLYTIKSDATYAIKHFYIDYDNLASVNAKEVNRI